MAKKGSDDIIDLIIALADMIGTVAKNMKKNLAICLMFGQMLLYGFVGNANGLGSFTGGVFRMGLQMVKDYLPTFQNK